MQCVIMIMLVGMYYIVPIWLLNRLSVNSHIANGIAISWIMTCCVLLVMSLASNQIAAIRQNTPAITNNFDIQLAERTKYREDTTVVTKCSKCGRARNAVPVEGKAMTAAATSAAGKTPLTVENIQEAVVKVLATQAPAAGAFTGMEDFERGNGFDLEEHTVFGTITEGITEDEEGTAGESDNSLRQGPNWAHLFTYTLSVITVGVGFITIVLGILMHLDTYADEVGSDMVGSCGFL